MFDMDLINAAMVRQNTDPEAAAARAAANAANAKKTELDHEDFLTLMITQLKNQDPFKPMDPTQYVGQLAQFSQVSGLAEVNKQITALTSSLRGNQVLDGASLIGRTIIAPGDEVYLGAGEDRGAQGLVDVPTGASAVKLIVKDASGALVRTQTLEPNKGTHAFTWDGKTDTGIDADPGKYQIEVVARIGNENVSLRTRVAAHVASVALDPATGGLTLDTDPLGDIAITDVERVL